MDKISMAIDAVRTKIPRLNYRLNEPMKNHTSFMIGGPVRAMFFPETAEELVELCGLLNGFDDMPLIIGNGTNLLVDDGKQLEMTVIKTTGIDNMTQTGETEITAGAGVSLKRLAEFACECGLSGLEYAHGIPGSLGGAVSMNAGAYGREMKDVVCSSRAFGVLAGMHVITAAQHGFGYRHSGFSEAGDIVLSSSVRLQKDEKKRIAEKMEDLHSMRSESQPLDLPSAGSTFKRAKDGYAAELIDRAGLKGCSVGGAQVSKKHSGFIVNNGGATFADIISLIEHVRETVLMRFGIELEPEIKIIKEK